MGLIFNKTYKEKITIKIWDSFYSKENIIKEKEIDDEKADLIVITTLGVFIFSIFEYKGNVEGNKFDNKWKIENNSKFVEIDNPYIKLDYFKEKISKELNLNENIYLMPLFDKIKSPNKYFYNIKSFRAFIDNLSNVFDKEMINEITEKIKNL